MNILKDRIKKFKEITKNFKHEEIASLVVAHKINKKKFKKLSDAAKKYVQLSKKYKFINRTPNGKIVPKKEVTNQYSKVITSYRDVILSMKFESKIKKWVLPVVRYKDVKIDRKFNYRPNRSELPHSDIWAGWDSNSILIQIPLLGDTKNNKVMYYEMPDKIKKNWFTKKTYKNAQTQFARLCNPINHHYKKGYVYLSDILAVHKTVKSKTCQPRASIDSPIILKSNQKKNSYGIGDCLNTIQIKNLGKKFAINCPLKMGEIDGVAGKKLPTTCEIIKL
jgi:hypothetical protein